MWGFVSKKEFKNLKTAFEVLEDEHKQLHGKHYNLYWDFLATSKDVSISVPTADGGEKSVPISEVVQKIIEHLGVKYHETPARSSLEKEEYNG